MAESKGKFNWGSLFIGIIFIITAMAAFRDPTSSLVAIVMVLGVSAIVDGIYQIFIRRAIREVTGYKSTFMIVIGVINIIVGIVLLFNIYGGVAVLPYVFAIWFIIRSIEGLLSSGLAKLVSKAYFWFTVTMNILGIILGVMLLKNPLSSVLTITYLVGSYFLFMGILNIAEAFTRRIND